MRKEDVLMALEMEEPFENGIAYDEGIGKKIAAIEQDGFSYAGVHTEEVCVSPKMITGGYGFFDENNFDTWFPEEVKVLTFTKGDENRYCIVKSNGDVLPYGLSRMRYINQSKSDFTNMALRCQALSEIMSEKHGINLSPVECFSLLDEFENSYGSDRDEEVELKQYLKVDRSNQLENFDIQYAESSLMNIKESLLEKLNSIDFDIYHELIRCGAERRYDALSIFYNPPAYRNSDEQKFDTQCFGRLSCQLLNQLISEKDMFFRADVVKALARCSHDKDLENKLLKNNYEKFVDKLHKAETKKQINSLANSFFKYSYRPYLNKFVLNELVNTILKTPDKINMNNLYGDELYKRMSDAKRTAEIFGFKNEEGKKISAAILNEYLLNEEGYEKEYSGDEYEKDKVISFINAIKDIATMTWFTSNDFDTEMYQKTYQIMNDLTKGDTLQNAVEKPLDNNLNVEPVMMNHLNEKISHAMDAYGYWDSCKELIKNNKPIEYEHRYINGIFDSIQDCCKEYNYYEDMCHDLKFSPNLKVILDIPYYERMNIPKEKLTVFDKENTYIKFNGNKYPLPDALTNSLNHIIGSKYNLPGLQLSDLIFTDKFLESEYSDIHKAEDIMMYGPDWASSVIGNTVREYTAWEDTRNVDTEQRCRNFLGYCLEHPIGFAVLRFNDDKCNTMTGFQERIESIEKQIEELDAYPEIRQMSNEELMAYLIKDDERLAEYLPEELKQVYKEYGTDFPAHLDCLHDKTPIQEIQNQTEPSKDVFVNTTDDKNVAESVTNKDINIASSKPKTIDELIGVAKKMSENDKKEGQDGQGNDDMKSDRKSDADGPGGL